MPQNINIKKITCNSRYGLCPIRINRKQSRQAWNFHEMIAGFLGGGGEIVGDPESGRLDAG